MLCLRRSFSNHSLAAAGTLGYFLSNLVHDKATSPESLPENVLSFITEHFQDENIAFAKEDRDLLKISYEIVLTDGTKLEFVATENGRKSTVTATASPTA